MKLFFEGQAYSTSLLEEWFKDNKYFIHKLRGKHGKSSLECVGYYYNADKEEHCYVLPKVFFFNQLPFGNEGLNWSEGLDIQISKKKNQSALSGWKEDILYELPIRLYSALDKYCRKKKSNKIAKEKDLLEIMSNIDEKNMSLLDIATGLRDFYYEHEDLFVFIYKETHKGYNKVNWSKTVRKQTPIINGEEVVYPLVNNRQRGVNYEEELLILLFNTLRYINLNLIQVNIEETEYELFSDYEFSHMIHCGEVANTLKEIQENYYNDTLVELWDLLWKFHSKIHSSGHGKTKKDDYLLVHKFNSVFEDMIDELLNPYHNEEYKFAKQTEREKKQDDGKIIDHLFKYRSLLAEKEEDSVYYIGDSKYYKEETELTGPALYKQYTYAKNIIQSQIDWFHEEKTRPEFKHYLKYRDEKTEGYTLTPNFFITGNVEKDSSWTKDDLKRTPNPNWVEGRTEPEYIEFEKHYQFENRLFDRDTLFLLQYDINFMFVLNAYVQKYNKVRKSFFDKAKEKFKEDFSSYISEGYSFYVMKYKQLPSLYNVSSDTNITLDVALDKYFRKLVGKVFCPSDTSELMVLALEKNKEDENATIDYLNEISKAFEIYPYQLGGNLKESLRKLFLPDVIHTIIEDEESGVRLVPQLDLFSFLPISSNIANEEYALVGYYRSSDHLEWIMKNQIYNRRAKSTSGNVVLKYEEIHAKFLILHNREIGTYAYKIKSILPYLKTKEELPITNAYRPSHDYYIIYDLESEPTTDLLVQSLVLSQKFSFRASHYRPFAVKLKALYSNVQLISAASSETEQQSPIIPYDYNIDDYIVRIVADDTVI